MPNAKRILAEGDILSIDCGVIIDGYYSDAAVTYPIGKVQPRGHEASARVTKASLERAIQQCQVGGRLGDISAPPCRSSAKPKASVSSASSSATGSAAPCTKIPKCPTSATRGKGPRLKAGMVLAIEPMINAGGPRLRSSRTAGPP